MEITAVAALKEIVPASAPPRVGVGAGVKAGVSPEGAGDGTADGKADGTVDGAGVGTADGEGVGTDVGAGVANRPPMEPSRRGSVPPRKPSASTCTMESPLVSS